MQRCPICSEPLDCGLHLIDRFPDGSPFLLCPSFEEFIMGPAVVMVELATGDMQAQSTTGED